MKSSTAATRYSFYLLFAATLIATTVRTIKTDLDFKVFHQAAAQYLQGSHRFYPTPGEPMGIFTYKYSPVFPILFSPFGYFSESSARVIWALLNALLWIACWVLSLRLLSRNGLKVGYGAQLLTVLMLADALTLNGHQGNTNVALLFLMLLAFERRSAAAAAFATSIKLTPAITLLYFACTRRWRTFAVSVALTAALLLVLPSVLFGFSETLELYRNWVYVLKDKSHFPFFKYTNQSVVAVAAHLGLTSAFTLGLWISINAVVVLALARSVIRRSEVDILCLCTMLILTVPSIVWKEYHVALLVPYLVVNQSLLERKESTAWYFLYAFRFILVHLLVMAFLGRYWAEKANAYGNLLWGVPLLAILLSRRTSAEK